ncbi:MAG: hypothetical protein WKG00_37245 [Polyangiaceae bacterium]
MLPRLPCPSRTAGATPLPTWGTPRTAPSKAPRAARSAPLLVAAGLLCAACGSEGVPGATDTVRPEHRDVIFQGGATDDALAALLATDPTTAETAYPYFATPADGTELAEPLRFSWKLSEPEARRAPAPRTAAPPWRTALGPLLELVGPVRSAHAATPRLDGRAFLAVFSTDSDDALLRVFTTELDYMPDAAAWSRLTSTPETITGWLLTGEFADDALVEGGGPFAGGWIQLTVER